MPKLQRWFIYEIRLSNMHLTHNPQCTIQNRNVHISFLNDALRDMGRVDCGICEIDLSHFPFYMDVITYPCGNGSYGLLPFIFITIYGIVCVRLAHFGLGDWNDIYIYIYLTRYYHQQIGSINLSHYHIFSVVVCLRCLLRHILSLIAYTFRENRDFVFIIIAQFMIGANSRIRLACRSYSFVCTLHHLIIIIVQTYLVTSNLWNACQINFVGWVSKIKHILSVIHYKRGGLCVFSHPFSCDDWENIYTCLLIIIKSSQES